MTVLLRVAIRRYDGETPTNRFGEVGFAFFPD